MSKTWKNFERIVAKYFNTDRTPLSGKNSLHNTSSDTLHNYLYIEAKRDKKYFGVTFRKLLHSVTDNAKKEKKIPVIALKEHNKKDFWIIIKAKDLVTVSKYISKEGYDG